MKTNQLVPTLWLALAALPAAAFAQLPSAPAAAPAPAEAPAEAPAAPETGLRFNFRGAPLETVLDYMSDAAGYAIVLETPVRGTVDMWSSRPVSRAEAVQLLNVALDKNGYAARVQGRTLIVSSKDAAKKQNIPVYTGNDPAEIPETAELVMQIIPLQHIDATQAVTDLGSLMPSSATLTANKDSNSLIVTDTRMNIHHIVEIVAALDTSGDSVSAIRVFPLHHADPTEMAQLLTTLFAGTTPSSAAGNPRGGFFPGAFFGRGGRPGFAAPAGATTTSSHSTPVVAVADPRTLSVVVTAARDQLPEIGGMIAKLDVQSGRKQKVFVYTMKNADVKQVEAVLKNLFQSNSSRSTATTTQADPLGTRASNNSQTTVATPSLSLSNGSGARGR